MQLVPVDHDPFADAKAPAPNLVPVDHDPFADVGKPTADMGSLAAAARGFMDGVPIAGPYLVEGVEALTAAGRALKNDTSYSSERDFVRRMHDTTAKTHPWVTTGSEIVGGMLGTAPAVAAAPAAFGISGAALPARMGAAALSGGALGGADAAVRSDGDVDDAKFGLALGATVGAASPAAGRLAGKVVSAFRGGEPGMAALREATQGLSEADLASAQFLRESAATLPGGGFALPVDEAVQAATGGRAPRLSQLSRVVGQSGGPGAGIVADAYAARPASIDNSVRASFDLFGPVGQGPTPLGFDVQAAARAGVAQTPEGQALAGAREALGPRVTPEQAGLAIQGDFRSLADRLEAARTTRGNADYGAARAAPERFGIDRTLPVEREGLPALQTLDPPARGPLKFDPPPEGPMSVADLKPTRGPAQPGRPQGDRSLRRFIAENGGIADQGGELRAGDHHRWYQPGIGRLVREDGKTIDEFWRPKLIESGYLPPDADGYMQRDIRDELFELLRQESRGQRVYPYDWAKNTDEAVRFSAMRDEYANASSLTKRDLGMALKEVGLEPRRLEKDVLDRAQAMLMRGEVTEPLDAYERAVMASREPVPRVTSREVPTTVTEDISAPRFGQASPMRTIGVVDDLMRSEKGDVLSALRSVRQGLLENSPDPLSGVREPEMAVNGLHRVRERLDRKIAEATERGDTVMAGRLQPVREALDADLKAVPEMATADANFAAASRPLEPFAGNNPLGRVTRRDDLTGRMQMPAEQVPGTLSGPTAAREVLAQPAPAAHRALEGRVVTQIVDQADQAGDVSADALRAAMRENEDVLAQMPGAQQRLTDLVTAREAMARVEASPLGRIAAEPDVQRATEALFARKPGMNSQGEVGAAMRALGANNPRAANELTRHYLEGVFDQAARDVRGVPAQYSGAAFASGVRGGPQQRQNLEAVVRALPDGGMKWQAVDRLLTVLEATGYRPMKGSGTAFNSAIQREMEAGTPLRKALVDVTTGAAAGGAVGGVAGGAGGAVVGMRRSLGDAYTRTRVMGQGEAIARLLYDPKALPDLRALAKSPPGSKNAELFTQRLLTLANGGGAPVRSPAER